MVESKTLFAVRLREPNKARGFKMRSYTSSAGSRYVTGAAGMPSPLRYVSDPKELAELRSIEQFEIITAPDENALRERLQVEMENRARVGFPAVRASIVDHESPTKVVVDEAPKLRPTALETVLEPVSIGDDEGDDMALAVAYQPEESKTRPAVVAEIPHDDAVSGPSPRTGGRKPRSKKSS